MRQREEVEKGGPQNRSGLQSYCIRLEVSGLVTHLWISAASSAGHLKDELGSLQHPLVKIGSWLKTHPSQNSFKNVYSPILLFILNW